MRKYHNKKTEVDGILFDSAREAHRYCELIMLQKAGRISDLKLQEEYELIPMAREPNTIGTRGGTKKGKVIEKAVKYIADFTYTENGEKIVEDVKGYRGGGAYAVFTIKRKLMLYMYGLKIKEVR